MALHILQYLIQSRMLDCVGLQGKKSITLSSMYNPSNDHAYKQHLACGVKQI